ncbi:hypothetical protein [Amycolatopsis sp. PS_44_ISF1]|uniref:hypothetical protein n=1 Tax=Amycolatopsis sp. PS_44_ISF1 TaxID=2974917 RepID=UPI0028DFDACA|nr:hypothetical protein [Amycolatopsis sp. PS_44_ISF1]MDT8913752.1 hypothetical protein [Amycolatopsis sp. PS_44_ISF1]
MTIDFRAYLGDTLAGVRRIHHALSETVERSVGAVEFRFESGRVLFMDSGPDGESIRMSAEAWVDPFEGAMTPENVEFVKESGKLTAFDTSHQEPFVSLIGTKVVDLAPMMALSNKVIGCVVNIDGVFVAVYTSFDDCYVARLP